MAELINKQKAIDVVVESHCYGTDIMEALQSLSTTTEAEIRAKTIDEVFEFLKRKRDKTYLRIDFDDLDIKKYKMRLAEQLKEK